MGVLPQENLKIWSALGAILGIFYAYLGLVVKYNFPYKFTIFLCINNISLNKRILGDLYRFHVEKGALITDHVECKLPITFHGGTPNHVSRRKKDINHNSRWKFQANHASRGWPPSPPPHISGAVVYKLSEWKRLSSPPPPPPINTLAKITRLSTRKSYMGIIFPNFTRKVYQKYNIRQVGVGSNIDQNNLSSLQETISAHNSCHFMWKCWQKVKLCKEGTSLNITLKQLPYSFGS